VRIIGNEYLLTVIVGDYRIPQGFWIRKCAFIDLTQASIMA
jgi:hypothetical protein